MRINLGTTKNKFRNVQTEIDGIKFASKAEAKKYRELKLLEQHGKIKDLKCQVLFNWQATYTLGDKSWTEKQRYIADFTFVEHGQLVVLDVKGFRTREYLKKRKLMKLLHGIEIRETK